MDYIKDISAMLIAYAPLVIGAILTLIIGFWIAGRISVLVRKAMDRRKIEATLATFLASLVSTLLKVLVVLSAASMFGLEVTAFVALFSALAFAVGLALQGNLGHMAAGILILLFRPYKVGDYVVTQGYEGHVREIQLLSTIIVTRDNRVVVIPNAGITSGPIENLSANPIRKVPMTFGISYNDDIDKARAVIQQVADSCPDVLHEKPVDIFVSELADSSINFAVRPWCDTEKFWDVHFYMHEHIKKEFDKAGVAIPFPQMDVHLEKLN